MNIRKIMTAAVEMCTTETPIFEVAAKMRTLNVGSIPVTENGELAGIITDRDIVTRGVADRLAIDTPVGKILSTHMIIGNPDMGIEEAAELMSSKQIRRLPIVENNRVVGIVSLGDIAVKNSSNHLAGEAIEDISKPAELN